MHRRASSAHRAVVAFVAAVLAAAPVTLGRPDASGALAADLYFSEYVEGSSNNKALEIFNDTGSAVDLATAGYNVQMFFNGAATAGLTVNLTGAIAPGDVFVLAQSAAAPAILAQADQTSGAGWFNGDDAVVLRVGTTVIDVIGQIGTDPGAEWGNALTSTADNTLRRTTAPDADGSDAFDPAVQWAGFAVDTFDGLGTAANDAAPAVTAVTPAGGAFAVPVDSTLTVTFSEPVTVTDPWFSLDCTTTGPIAATASGGPTTFTLDPVADFAVPEDCTLRILAAGVADADASDPPDTMAADVESAFSTATICDVAHTPIPQIQGSGPAAAITGPVTTRGIVVGDYEGPPPANLRGFYLQDPTGDGDPATSDAIFVFEGNNADAVSVGDEVAVSGAAGEFQDQTQITASTVVGCGDGPATIAPSDVVFPTPAAGHLERVEGMLVRLPQTMYVTEHFQLGRFGQVLLSSGGRLDQPTNVVAPGAPAAALQAANDLNKILLDDASQAQNPDPIVFGRGGQPLSASNTLRGGDTATGIVGVMTYTWAGNAASGNAFRVRPVGALGGSALFEAVNARPGPVPKAGTLRTGALNMLNYFNTFDGLPDSVDNCTNGVGGPATDCRGADTQAEFDRQWPKTVAAITGIDAAVLGIIEIENDGYGSDSAIHHLVDRLNAATAPGTYAFIDADAATGQVNALGTDAIKVGLLYKPAKVVPVGRTGALNTEAFVNGGDGFPRSRPALAQAFLERSSGSVFVGVVNHFKSKGSSCDAPDALDGQGNCNAVRVVAAQELAEWLAGDPTGTGDSDVLILGDLNAYAMEDPITTLKAAGYTDLIAARVADPYSFVFDGQWGYLDHALGSTSVLSQVAGVSEWHINADEPSVLDYNTDFKTPNLIASLYAPDRFRVADHDPVLVDLALRGPAKGLVAGAGTYTSPAGSFPAQPTRSARATFAIAASYVPGVRLPVGATLVTSLGYGLIFTSLSNDWLVVNPAAGTAEYAGTGRVNGQAGFRFSVSAVDGSTADSARIRVWNASSGATVYDSGVVALGNGAVVVRN